MVIILNILYCGDANIADGVLMSSLSIAKYSGEPLKIYILTAGFDCSSVLCKPLPESFGIFLSSCLKNINKRNEVRLIDISDKLSACFPVANINTRFTPCCMLRLFADTVECIPDRILYLDNDVICEDIFSSFYYMDISKYELCGVIDNYGGWFFHNELKVRDYINSGVLLLNMKKIRQTRLFQKCRIMCRDKKMFMPDQSSLNKLAKYKMICDRRYNEQKRSRENTVFRHFTTTFSVFPYFRKISVKPWNETEMHKILRNFEYDDLICEYKHIKEKSNNFSQEISNE